VFITRDNQRYILEEPYLAANTCTLSGSYIQAGRSFKINEDEYVVLGDNRGVSLDSRMLGLVKKSDIIGRVSFRFYPLDKLGFVK
jgi:signal peptidase I